MKPFILLIFILFLTGSRINGQNPEPSTSDKKVYSVSLHTGLNQIREKSLLPLVHKGMATELMFETEKVKHDMRRFEFLFTYSRLKTSLEEMAKSGNISLGLKYAYTFLVFQKNNLRYYLGPQTSLCYAFMVYPNWDESHSYWADYLAFGARNVISVSLRHENEWFTSMSFPVLGFFSRPDVVRPYKIDDISAGGMMKAFNSNIETGFMNKLLLINYKTEYRFPAFTNKREAITFNLDIIRMSRKDGYPVFQIITMFGIKFML
jgi:hypothetical protein